MPTQQTPTPERSGELNPDPITGEPGAHPVGTGLGAAAAGDAGAAIGLAGGPIGAAIGAVIGAVAGGYAGKGVAEIIDPTAEDAYWRENHGRQPYAAADRSYEDYAPAYRTGYTGYREGQRFDDREADLRTEYEGGIQRSQTGEARTGDDPAAIPGTIQNNLSTHRLRWDDARAAARAAYERASRGKVEGTEVKPGPMID